MDGKFLWPENFGEKEYNNRRASYERQGLGYLFAREYDSEAAGKHDFMFKANEFIILDQPKEYKLIGMAVDPAISDNQRADYSAIVVAGVTDDNKIEVLDSYGKRGALPSILIDKIFELQKRWDARIVGIESIAWQRALVHILQERMVEYGQFFKVEPITHGRVAKVERIESVLQPVWNSKQLAFVGEHPLLVEQMKAWPNGAHDDAVDALSMAIVLLAPWMRKPAKQHTNPNVKKYKLRIAQTAEEPSAALDWFAFSKNEKDKKEDLIRKLKSAFK